METLEYIKKEAQNPDGTDAGRPSQMLERNKSSLPPEKSDEM
jgi:hypothetical protein